MRALPNWIGGRLESGEYACHVAPDMKPEEADIVVHVGNHHEAARAFVSGSAWRNWIEEDKPLVVTVRGSDLEPKLIAVSAERAVTYRTREVAPPDGGEGTGR